MFNAIEYIEKLLKDHPSLRDDDNLLIAKVWSTELKNRGFTKLNLMDEFAGGNLTSPESITRVRRRLQEKNPNLRGLTYENRQERGNKIKSIIKSFK